MSASTINDPFRDLHGDEPSVRGSVAYFRSKGSWRCDWPNSKIQKSPNRYQEGSFVMSPFAFTAISFLSFPSILLPKLLSYQKSYNFSSC